MAPPTCFLRQPSLEETSGLLLLLPDSPFICPVCTAELLLSPLLNNLSAHMEIPVQAQPSLPCKCHALCVLSCPLLPPRWSSLPPLASTFNCCKLAVGCWVPSRGVGTQLCPQLCGTGHMEVVVHGQEHHVPSSTLSHSACSVAGAGAPLDIRALLGTLKHVFLSFSLAPQVHPVLSCGGGCIAQLILTPGSHPHITPQQPSVPRGPGQREVMDLPEQPGQVLEESKSWCQPGVSCRQIEQRQSWQR